MKFIKCVIDKRGIAYHAVCNSMYFYDIFGYAYSGIYKFLVFTYHACGCKAYSPYFYNAVECRVDPGCF